MSTLANARDVLRLMAHLQRDVTVTDVAAELGLPKSSVSRTLSMMAEYGFLDRDPLTRAYRPGGLIMEASYHFRTSRGTVSLLEEEAARLVADTGYTGYVDVLDGSESLVLHMRIGTGALQAYTPAGTRAPGYASSMGRALLARLDDAEVLRLYDDGPTRLEHSTGTAPATRRELLATLARVRADGWDVSRGEWVQGVGGISSAVLDSDTGQIFGIGIALPASDLRDDAVATRYGRAVREVARRVGKRIGDPYWLRFTEPGD
ncbi:IclR family transcriptional regulator [Streptomyces sp. VRA16 Mangrove soil]|uniref:IclR family transcriptional regulator n=1 Tax=Streptomyces sp. VRA16 Mangrove soil TaxID=2817434 RepID=UPI001A9E6BBA|nr:IclR family transcriptional regulator [Streptomyces sp. VRA16 Mangrove soil]MBO1334762.1 IclR family transcriptional regulator [Streptomyces sp. VRA16 Mangrove soil]